MLKKTVILCFVIGLLSITFFAQAPAFDWAKTMGAINYDYTYDMILDNEGNVYTTGKFQGTVDFDPGPEVFSITSIGTTSLFISKLDAQGNFLWAKALTGTGRCSGNSIKINPLENGSIYLTGNFKGTIDFDPGNGVFNLTAVGVNNNAFFCKLDGLGNFVWAKQIGNEEYCSGISLAIDQVNNGDICITGRFLGTVDFNPDGGVLKFN